MGTDKAKIAGKKYLLILGLKEALLVSDPIFAKNGMASKIIAYSQGSLIEVFSDITPNPTLANVDDCASIIREKNIEFVACAWRRKLS